MNVSKSDEVMARRNVDFVKPTVDAFELRHNQSHRNGQMTFNSTSHTAP